jgi:hypothetical protein
MIYAKFWILVIILFISIISLFFKKKSENGSISIQLNRNRSKSEIIASEEFKKIIQEYGGNKKNIKYNIRPNFLRNPETGRCLEIDMYYEDNEIKIGVEYNGIQHIKFPNYFHKDTELGKANFDSLQKRDKLKRRLCRENNINLITIPYTCDTCDYVNGEYIYNSKIDILTRRKRIREYLIPRINRCLIENQH